MLVSILRFSRFVSPMLISLSLACFPYSYEKRYFLTLFDSRTSEVLTVTLQLYIGEANWAFIFGVIVGTCGPHYGLFVRLTLITRSLWSKHIQSSVLGWRL